MKNSDTDICSPIIKAAQIASQLNQGDSSSNSSWK